LLFRDLWTKVNHLRQKLFHQILEILSQSDFSDEVYHQISNVSEIILEIFENSTSDIVGTDNISLTFGSLLVPLRNSEIYSLLKIPNLISKLINFSQKSKLTINFALASSELNLGIANMNRHLQEKLKSGLLPGQCTYFHSVSRKTLQYFEILESLVSTEDIAVYEVLAKHRVLDSMMVVPKLLGFLRSIPME
jgi:hypothetical protein